MVNVTHRDLEQIDLILTKLGTTKDSPWSSYTIAMNRSRCAPYLEAIKAARELSKEEEDYRKAKVELLEKYAKKDDKGEVIKKLVPGPEGSAGWNYDIEDTEACTNSISSLIKEKFPNIEKHTQRKAEELISLLNAELEIEFIPIKMSEDISKAVSGNELFLLLSKNIVVEEECIKDK